MTLEESLVSLGSGVIALAGSVVWGEVRNRVLTKRTSDGRTWRALVKNHVYNGFDIIKARLYDTLEHQIEERIRDGQKTDPVKLPHKMNANMPLEKRCDMIRDNIKSVIEGVRSTARFQLTNEPLEKMTEDEVQLFIENLAKNTRDTINNNMIKNAYKSPVVDDLMLGFSYAELLDDITCLVGHAIRNKPSRIR